MTKSAIRPETNLQFVHETKLGAIYISVSGQTLTGIHWVKQLTPLISSLSSQEPSQRFIQKVVQQIDQYLTGKRRTFELPMDVQGTDFQKSVWRELSKIPFGETRSYAEIAARVGRPRAVRAVGTANGRNPFCLIVPCHRVIAGDGTLAGYAGGMKAKELLLKLEGWEVPAGVSKRSKLRPLKSKRGQ